MTLDDLVKKLRDDKGSNGGYGVLESDLKKLREYIQRRDTTNNTREYSFAWDYIREEYQFIFGFIWGIRCLDYISKAEYNELMKDLEEVVHK